MSPGKRGERLPLNYPGPGYVVTDHLLPSNAASTRTSHWLLPQIVQVEHFSLRDIPNLSVTLVIPIGGLFKHESYMPWVVYIVYACRRFSKSVSLKIMASSQNFLVWFRGVLICQQGLIPRRTKSCWVSDPAERSPAGYQTPPNNNSIRIYLQILNRIKK